MLAGVCHEGLWAVAAPTAAQRYRSSLPGWNRRGELAEVLAQRVRSCSQCSACRKSKHPLTDMEYPIRINDVAKTVCGMLGVKNVANNGVYLLKNNGSSWDAFLNGEAKNE